MKKIKYLLLVCFVVTIVGCSKQEELHLVKGSDVVFTDAAKDSMIVEFYTLSDSSLNFAKVYYQGQEYTLPQVVSADGARYGDGRDLSIWIKGDKLTLNQKDVDNAKSLEFSTAQS